MKSKTSIANTVDDPTIQFSKLTIDDKTYSLCYSWKSIVKARKLTGANLMHGLQNLNQLEVDELDGLFFAALMTAHPEMTHDDASQLLHIDNYMIVYAALIEAYSLTVKKKAEEGEAEPEGEAVVS